MIALRQPEPPPRPDPPPKREPGPRIAATLRRARRRASFGRRWLHGARNHPGWKPAALYSALCWAAALQRDTNHPVGYAIAASMTLLMFGCVICTCASAPMPTEADDKP